MPWTKEEWEALEAEYDQDYSLAMIDAMAKLADAPEGTSVIVGNVKLTAGKVIWEDRSL